MAISRKIPIKASTKLYYGKFPFMVSIESYRLFPYSRFMNSIKFDKQVSEYALQLDKYCPIDKTVWRSVKTDISGCVLSKFYFLEIKDRDYFVKNVYKNKKLVAKISVVQPQSSEHLTLLQSDHRIVTRKTKFHGSYTWKISFKFLNYHNRIELDNWISAMYGGVSETADTARFKYDALCNKPMLYLNDEEDIMLVKIAHSATVHKIEKAVIITK